MVLSRRIINTLKTVLYCSAIKIVSILSTLMNWITITFSAESLWFFLDVWQRVVLSTITIFWDDGDHQDQEGGLPHQAHLHGVHGEVQAPHQRLPPSTQSWLQTSNIQDLSVGAWESRLSAWEDKGVPEGRSWPLPGAGEGPRLDQEDPGPAEMHPWMVS